MGMGNKQKQTLLDVSMELKMTSRQLERQSMKLEGGEKNEMKKIKDALDKNQMENAKVFAENVIRNRKEAINLRRFGVKMGALAAKLESAHCTQQISTQIQQSVPMLQKCMKQMDSLGVAGSIGSFEQVFEDLDVKTGDMNAALDNIYSTSIDNSEVMELLTAMQYQQVMEAGGEINAGTGAIAAPVGQAAQAQDVDDMQARLNQLKN